MISNRISGIEPITNQYNSLGAKTSKIVSNLRESYSAVYTNNVWARHTSLFLLLWYILSALFGVAVLLLWEPLSVLTADGLYAFFDWETTPESLFVLKLMLLTFVISRVYALVKGFVNRKLSGCNRRINRVEKQINTKVEQYKSKGALDYIRNSVEKNIHIEFLADNKLGDEVVNLRERIQNLDKKLTTTRKICAILVVIALLGVTVYGILTGLAPQLEDGLATESIWAVAAMLLFVTEVIIVIMLNVGPYLGKLTKPLGVLLCLIFCGVYGLLLKDNAFCILGEEMLEMTSLESDNFWLSTTFIFPVLTALAMIMVICFTQLGGELDKLTNGYQVDMSYGNDKSSGKVRTYILGAIYAVCIFVLLYMMKCWVDGDLLLFFIAVIFWWFMNQLVHPRGRRLYAFWGVGRCIANEVMLALLCLMTMAVARGGLDFMDLSFVFNLLIMSKVIGGIATFINNRIY